MADNRKTDIIQKANSLGIEVAGTRLLAVAIFVRAVLDSKALNKKNRDTDIFDGVPVSKKELDLFYESGWCDSLIMGVGLPVDAVLAGCGVPSY